MSRSPKELLAYGHLREVDRDSIEATLIHRQMVERKPFLRDIYVEWIESIQKWRPKEAGPGPTVELGSGSSLLKGLHPEVIASDVAPVPGVDLVCDGCQLPFARGSISCYVLILVLHHLPDVPAFLRQSAATVRTGGRVIMIEPWMSPLWRLIRRVLRHEPCDMQAASWTLQSGGKRLSSANQAMAWLVFERDRALFEHHHPQWRLLRLELTMPFRYLLSGGVNYRALVPAWSFGFWREVEKLFSPINRLLAGFCLIVLERTEVPADPTP
ncbi:MAG: methyltransferase domain-containing protein [Magnetococcales bacterium]|nr:methyltransferase domain-containing protein [Magnetococcales bacterium]